MTNRYTEEIVAFRNSGSYHLFEASFNPLNKYEFVTVGTQYITIWNIDDRNLNRQYLINVADEIASQNGNTICITTVDYLLYR